MKKTLCIKCNKEITNNNFERHLQSCGIIKSSLKKKKIRGIDYDPNWGYKTGTRQIWNKGLTKKDHQSLNRPERKGKKFGSAITGHSEETKKKISESRRKFLIENPNMVPYKLNHSSKESYPEKYFNNVFQKHGLTYEKEYQIGLYSLDFAFLDKKIDVEIDGEQHYVDQRIVESDIRRSEFLSNKGWSLIRIRWSAFKKLDRNEKERYVNNIIKQLMDP